MAKHEKVFLLDDGSKLKVVVEMMTHLNKKPTYRVSGYSCPKGKRTWTNVVNTDGFEYRKLSMTERTKFNLDECSRIVGADRISETANELWHSIMPQLNINFE